MHVMIDDTSLTSGNQWRNNQSFPTEFQFMHVENKKKTQNSFYLNVRVY